VSEQTQSESGAAGANGERAGTGGDAEHVARGAAGANGERAGTGGDAGTGEHVARGAAGANSEGTGGDAGAGEHVGRSDDGADGEGVGRGQDDRPREEIGGIDGITRFMGMRWEDPETVRLTIRPELINRGGLLSGVVTYALVDYCMGSALWVQTSEQERIATINIAINYVQTATEGDIVCRTTVDRRNRSNAVLHSEVRHEDGRLLVTAIGSYTIFVPRELRSGAARSG
jgi:uncharacterized protein (TIGR00369 family)